MIYSGGMEIATRQYGKFGLSIIGAVAGILIIVRLAQYITDHMPIIHWFLQKTGQATIIILMIHTLLRPFIEKIVINVVETESFSFLIICTAAQILLAMGIKYLIAKSDLVIHRVKK